MSSNRKTAREALATLLSTALTGGGGLAQAVYSYRVGDFGGASPVVIVSSQGSRRERSTFQGSRNTVFLQVDIFVLYAAVGWTEQDAETRLDDIEAAIAGVVDANQETANWLALNWADRSQRVDVAIGGVDYIRELLVLAAEVWG